jgi:hypothetical protein
MWPFKCRIFRDHDYVVRRAPDALFLECKRCGTRSIGWNLSGGRVRRGSPLRLVIDESAIPFRVDAAATHGAAISSVMAEVPEMRLRFSREL